MPKYLGSQHRTGTPKARESLAKQTKRYDFPDKRKVSDSYSHDLESLVKTAGLKSELDAAVSSDPEFERRWATVKEWSEASRYETHNRLKAQSLYDAITHPAHGVLLWIERFW